MIIIICMVVADPMLPRIWVRGQANMGLSFIVHAVSKDCISMIYSTGNTSLWGEGIWEGNSFLFTSFGFLPDRVTHWSCAKIALLKLVKKGGRLSWRMVNHGTLGSCVAEYCACLACRWLSDERGSLHLNQYPKSVFEVLVFTQDSSDYKDGQNKTSPKQHFSFSVIQWMIWLFLSWIRYWTTFRIFCEKRSYFAAHLCAVH